MRCSKQINKRYIIKLTGPRRKKRQIKTEFSSRDYQNSSNSYLLKYIEEHKVMKTASDHRHKVMNDTQQTTKHNDNQDKTYEQHTQKQR